MRAHLIMTIPFDGSVLDRAVHPLDLAVGPRVVGFPQPMLDPIGFADHVEAHWPGIDGVAVPWLLDELDSVVRQDGVDLVGHSLKHVLKEFPCGAPVSLVHQLANGERAGAVNADKEREFAFSGLHFGNVDVKEPDRVAFELLTLWLVPFDIRQTRYAVALQAPMKGRARQMWDRRL
jgi:hypothetical protein